MLSENQVRRLLKQCDKVDDSYGYDVPSELELVAEVNRLKRQTGELELMLEEGETYIRGIRKEPLVSPDIPKTDYLGREIGDTPKDTTFNRVLKSIKQTVNHTEEAALEKDAST